MNILIVSGRVGRDPELKITQEGTPVCKFSLAVPKWNSSTKKEDTMWLNVVCWRNLAERADKIVQKGTLIGVRGRLDIREYEWEGSKRTSVEVVADDFDMYIWPKQQGEAKPYNDEDWMPPSE